jgi:hypothetical protein
LSVAPALPPLLDAGGWVLTGAGLPLDDAWPTVRPWNAFAAAIEISPVKPTAPAIIQRLIREISARPASRLFTACGGMRSVCARARRVP